MGLADQIRKLTSSGQDSAARFKICLTLRMSRLRIVIVKRLPAILVAVLVGLPLLLGATGSPEENPAMSSDRAMSGLRGPVKSCSEESVFTPIAGTGATASEVRSESTSEYDADGRILQRRSRNSDGSYWVMRYEYTSSGRLLKTVSGTEGQPLTETHYAYSYDPQGRLQSITTDEKSKAPVSFRYDELGRKTKIETSRAEDYRASMASVGSPFEAADQAPNLPGGGSATTVYDEHDRPIEVQVRDASGEQLSHALRTYDAGGHVIEEKQLIDNFVGMVPPDARAKILKESGLSPEQLQSELSKKIAHLMGGQAETYTVRYRYDSGGHLIHTSRRIFNQEDEIDATDNEHGDAASEITRGTRLAGENNPAAAPSTSYSEVQYSYEYDPRGNWTVKTTSYRSGADAPFQTSTVERRTLKYY